MTYIVHIDKGSRAEQEHTIEATTFSTAKRKTTSLMKELGYIPYEEWYGEKHNPKRSYIEDDKTKLYRDCKLVFVSLTTKEFHGREKGEDKVYSEVFKLVEQMHERMCRPDDRTIGDTTKMAQQLIDLVQV